MPRNAVFTDRPPLFTFKDINDKALLRPVHHSETANPISALRQSAPASLYLASLILHRHGVRTPYAGGPEA
jgi:hypothetical protein